MMRKFISKKWILFSGLAMSGLLLVNSPTTTVKAVDSGTATTTETKGQTDNTAAKNDDNGFKIPDDAIAKNSDSDGFEWYIGSDKTLHIGPGTLPSSGNWNNVWPNYADDITTISFDGEVKAPSDMTEYFAQLSSLKDVKNMDNLDTSQTQYMTYLFALDPKLESIDVSTLDTSNVTDMSYMFSTWSPSISVSENTSLTKLNVSNWDLSKVTNLASAFQGDAALESLDVSNWNVKNVSTMDNTFNGDSSLSSLDVSKWNTPQLSSSIGTFQDDSKIKELDVSNWDVKSDASFNAMFKGDSSLISLDLSKWNMEDSVQLGNAGSDGIFDGTDLNYIKLGPNNFFNPSNGTNVLLPSTKSKTWSNDDKTLSFSATDSSDSIGKYYDKKNNPAGVQTFTPQRESITADVTIKSNLGDLIVPNVTGPTGKQITVDVPQKDGYTSDKKTVTATVNAIGTITTDETVKYTKITKPSGGSHGSSSNNNNNQNNNNDKNKVTTETKKQTINTYNGKDIPIYTLDSENKMVLINNKALSNDSGWYSDQKLVVNNDTYYRVATNEYVKATQAYPYESTKAVLRTTNSNKRIYMADGKLITNRELAADSDWYTDQIVQINGEKYYRVATNEFVKANDSNIYKTL